VSQRVNITHPPHPAFDRALEVCAETFKATFLDDENQGILKDEERYTTFLNRIPDDDKLFVELKQSLAREWSKDGGKSSARRWKQFEMTVEAMASRTKTLSKEADRLRKLVNQMVLFHCYPRLDENVSTHRNHLLKSPFVIHPKTGKVCVPIFNVDRAHEFNPNAVPTLATLIDELDAGKSANNSLQDYVKRFEAEFLLPMREARELEASRKAKLAKREADERQAATTGDW